MISFLSGKIITKTKNSLILETAGGVGYEIRMTGLELGQFSGGQTISLYTYLKVTDSDLSLYGFRSVEERAFFVMLLSVSGVGPKSAMNIMSFGSIADIRSAVARGDVKYLTAVQGMGKKTAERMVLELRGKIQDTRSEWSNEKNSGVLIDVMEGLTAMGYSAEEVSEAVRLLDITDASVETLLREALRLLSRNN